MSKGKPRKPEMKSAEVARELVEERQAEEVQVVVSVRPVLWSQFVALMPPGTAPATAVGELIRVWTRQEYQRRMLEQFDRGMA